MPEKTKLGKTTALKVAASVCGGVDYVQQWRATSNGLEGVARYHNDMLLVLDELSQVDANEIFHIIYMLANGKSKIRANQIGASRSVSDWQLLWLSAGEVGLETLMTEGNKKIKVGQQIRQVDLQSNACRNLNGETLGIFENIHGLENGAEFSNLLTKNATNHHGVVLVEWLKVLVTNYDLVFDQMKASHEEYTYKLLKNYMNIEGQTRRVASAFALIAVAGEYATKTGITGWEADDTYSAVKLIFDEWVISKGGANNQEENQILRQVKSFFEQHGQSLFEQINNEGTRVDGNSQHAIRDRVGYIDKDCSGTKFYVFPEQCKNRVLKGLNSLTALKVLIEKKWLLQDIQGKSSQKIRIPYMKNPARMYIFDANAIFGDEDLYKNPQVNKPILSLV